ncbi:MAG TPA: phytanoyl-CoA dioxygenase family protein [Armatimonadota bacterium]|nr:phytanoyl-CoA dioxygenase family protein [Armatimonadota bacterium]
MAMTISSKARVEDIEVFADNLDPERAAEIYREHGCLVARGLMKPYIAAIQRDIETTAQQALALLDQARAVPEGWVTPDGTLFIPAPPGFVRDRQLMVLGISYATSGAFFQAAFDKKALDILEAIIGPNIELFMNGQCLYKEPVGGHPKNLHQDSAYFEHRFDGPVATLNYVVDTDLVNGALHVVPGSHRMGTLQHIDTLSHLALDEHEWPWESALPVCGNAGDAIFFHYKTIHGSKENHSSKPRPVFINRYRRPDDYVTISATSAANRAEAEKRESEAKKANQRGFMVRGFRKYEG